MVDKKDVVLIIIIIIGLFWAMIAFSGGLNELFRQGQQLNQTQYLFNQSLLFEKQQKHEDAARANQTAYENQARDAQRYQIVKDTNKSINQLEQNVNQFILDSENRSKIGFKERDKILNEVLQLQTENKNTQIILNSTLNQLTNITINDANKAEEARKLIVGLLTLILSNQQVFFDISEELLNMTNKSNHNSDAINSSHHAILNMLNNITKSIK